MQHKKTFKLQCNYKLLERLMNTYGVSGSEQLVRSIIEKEIKKYVKETYTDKLGNLIAHIKGKKPRVMIAAHMDEVGLMVSKIDEDGNIKCSVIGGIDPVTLIGSKVHIETKNKNIHGVITTPEISNGEDLKKVPQIQDLIVDTGMDKKELIKEGVEIGTYVSLERKYTELGKMRFAGKSLDDRIGCFILIELAKRLKNCKNDLYLVFTVQEEVGLYGAKTSAYHIDPDWGIVIDVTTADDKSIEPTRVIGKGPVITIKDADMIANKCINEWIRNAAKKKKIPLQLEVSEFGTTDALNISLSRGGVPSAVLGVPVRNLHTTVGIAHKRDIENCVLLLTELLKKTPKAIC